MKSFPIDDIRQQFPALSNSGKGGSPVYFDNPAGTQIPRSVIDAVAMAMQTAASNLGGYFAASASAGEIWQSAHEAMADLLGAGSGREIIIGPSMTTLTLHLSRSIGRLLAEGDEIIVTRMDHEADVAPWLLLAEDLGLVVKWLPFNKDTWRIEAEDLEALLGDRTRLLALNYASNLTGSVNDIGRLVRMAKDAGALVFVDAVQFAPHGLPDVQALDCDFFACSSYKFYGPHLGIVWAREALLAELSAYKCRCSSNDLPQKFETGTPQTELLAGLAATVGYLEGIGETLSFRGSRRDKLRGAYDSFSSYENDLTWRLISGIQSLPGTTVHGITNPNRQADRVPTVSFSHSEKPPQEIAKFLGANDVYVWSGHNYAYEVVRHLGIDEDEGVVRIGLAHYNTADEVDRALRLLERGL